MAEVVDQTKTRGPRPGFNTFGTRLYTVMLSRGVVTAAKLAQMMGKTGRGVSAQTVSNYWTGKTMPSKEFMQNLATVLELSIEEKRDLSTAIYYDE